MNLPRLIRRAGTSASVAGVSAVVLLLTAAAAEASPLYCGAGRSLTAEGAIAGAVEDAENSASGDGLFTCVLAEEPEVFFVPNDPYRGDFYRASVVMSCTP